MMIDKVKNTIERYSMLKNAEKVLLCVSGGADSTAMFYVFNSLKKSMGLKLFVAHLNHKLRGKDSDQDEEYVKRLVRKHKLPVVTAGKDVRRFAGSARLSLEQAARKARYDFFLTTAKELKLKIIATAHTRDDQAETVLMRLLRGTGLRGLRGISPVRRSNGFRIIRPLIDIRRKEIDGYLRENRIKPRVDASNLKPEFFRNKIRLKLLPLIEREYSPEIKELLASLADLLNTDYDYLNLQQEKIFKKLAKVKRPGLITFSLAALKREHLSARRALMRKAIESLKGGLEGIGYRHWQELEELLYKRPPGSIVYLPGKAEVLKSRTALIFSRGPMAKSKKIKIGPLPVKIPGQTRFGHKIIEAEVVKRPLCINRHPKTEEYFDFKKISFPLILRPRRPGDRMRPLGMKGYKKIKDILIDEKIPSRKRNSIPLVVSGNGEIIWLCGIKMSDSCKISAGTKKALKLKLR